ncbi:histidine phosphatase family protein [Nonomuraea sp. NPDC050556]|uniref:histidine phosphatase family protein n=1 Tax=Nonomuraea sp. NPDC050556 TaxID=3364369 RepID=UPI00378FE268
MTATRFLYLARHGEALPDESGLTEAGKLQATLLGKRLRDVSLSAVHHSPVTRAVQTARLTTLGPLVESAEAGDYLPYMPSADELPEDSADSLMAFLAQWTEEEQRTGPELARQALTRFTGPADGNTPVRELIVTHAFLIGWLVRDAMGAPPWRWLTINAANAALTVIRYTPGKPASVLCLNDMTHLPTELHWTGHPPETTP